MSYPFTNKETDWAVGKLTACSYPAPVGYMVKVNGKYVTLSGKSVFPSKGNATLYISKALNGSYGYGKYLMEAMGLPFDRKEGARLIKQLRDHLIKTGIMEVVEYKN